MTETAAPQQPVTGEQKPTETVGQTTPQQPTETVESLAAKLASAEKRIGELNKESEKHRKQADEWQAAKKAEEDAKLSETEKLRKSLDEATKAQVAAIQKANDRLVRAEILAKAGKFIDADAAFLLVDRSKVTVDENGTVTGVEAALDELAKSKPHLVKQQQFNRTTSATNPDVTNNTRETDAQKRERLLGSGTNIWKAN